MDSGTLGWTENKFTGGNRGNGDNRFSVDKLHEAYYRSLKFTNLFTSGASKRKLELNRLSSVSQKIVTVTYKGFIREEPLRFDILVEGCVLVEAKAVAEILPIA